MRCIFQRNWHSSVRMEEQNLLTEVTYCGTDREACARFIVDTATLVIKEAAWEKYRTPGKKGWELMNLPQLIGVEAYLGSGGTIRQILAPLNDPYAYQLFAEGVRGIIQAETFIFTERGHSSGDDYQKFWEKHYANSCRYFSYPERVTKGWFEHIGYNDRRGNLFNRVIALALYLKKDSYLLHGQFNDSFHSICVNLELEKEKPFIKGRMRFSKGSDLVCEEAEAYMKDLEGKNLSF